MARWRRFWRQLNHGAPDPADVQEAPLTLAPCHRVALEVQDVLSRLREDLLPQLQADFPGLTHSFGGRQETMREAVRSFYSSVTLALLGVYVLLAIPFRSYLQPLVVMAAIPFGIVGAVLGHLVMGFGLSLISIMGIIALGGMVVNGALVMIDYANARLREGHTPFAAVHAAGVRRFRPIALTTMTTFGGLAPMIFETSMQARFMIPMAVSLGYGIVISSAILLFLIPCLFLAVDDLRRLVLGTGVEQGAVPAEGTVGAASAAISPGAGPQRHRG